jgi:pyridoxamine 5'-phosphate oxidase family protein
MARDTFTDAEIAYLEAQPLGRIATVDTDGAPRVVPTGFRYNRATGTIDCGGIDLAATRRYRDVRSNPAVAIAIDDLASVDPWEPRAVMVRGRAELLDHGGTAFGPEFSQTLMRISPTSISSLGIDAEA